MANVWWADTGGSIDTCECWCKGDGAICVGVDPSDVRAKCIFEKIRDLAAQGCHIANLSITVTYSQSDVIFVIPS